MFALIAVVMAAEAPAAEAPASEAPAAVAPAAEAPAAEAPIENAPAAEAPIADAPAAEAPLDVYSVNPWVDGVVIAASAFAIAVPYALPGAFITPSCPCDPNDLPAFDRFAVDLESDVADITSHVEVGLAIVVPLVMDALDVGLNKTLLDDAVVYAETIAVNAALTTIVKFTTKRPLPRVYARPQSDLAESPYGYDSFYSGHVSNAVAALSAASMTYTLRYGFAAWPWVATAIVGASVGMERIAAGQHFPSDVVASAAAGLAVGVIVPWLHRRNGSLSVVPTGDGATVSLRLPL